MNTNVGCCVLLLVVELLAFAELDPDSDDVFKSIQGTATCLPEPRELEEETPVLLDEVLELVELLLGDVLLLLELFPDSEMMANSSRPDAGLTIVSLIVPTWVPELPKTCAPVSWLPFTASCMRPVALR